MPGGSHFQRSYPKGEHLLLDGGLNTKFARSIIDDSESPDCQNVIFKDGAVQTREGASKLNTTAIGSFVCDGIYSRRANDNTETMIVFAGGSAWQLAGTTFSTIASAQSVFTAGVRVGASFQENHLFAGNGYVIPYKWSGTDWTRHGVYPPSSGALGASSAFSAASAPTGAVLASGSSYTYKFVFVNSAVVESDVGDQITFVVTANSMGNIRLTSLPVAPQSWGISSRRIYRTVAGGSAFKRVATISDNTTTTYDDGVADASLGAAAPTDNGVPPKYSTIIYHQQRLFMNDVANPNYVWWTELGTPYTVASTNFQKIGDKTTDLVKAFGVFDNALIVFCEKSITIGYMKDTTASNWVWQSIPVPFGSKSPYCVIPFNGKLLFAAYQNDKFVGFAALHGDTVQPDSTLLTVSAAGSDLKSNRIETDMFDVQESYTGNISGIAYNNRAYIALTKASGNTTNNRIYVMDFSMENLGRKHKESWVPWTGLNPAQFCVYGGNLYYGSSTATGFVYKLESGVYSDDGTAINSYYWTKEFPGYPGDEGRTKDHRHLNVLIDNAGTYYMDISVRTDSDPGNGTTYQVSIDPGGTTWNAFTWGSAVWGAGSSQKEYLLPLGGARGKRVQYKFSNQNKVNQRFKVHWMGYYYNLKGRR